MENEKLGANAMKPLAAGRSSPDFLDFEFAHEKKDYGSVRKQSCMNF